MILGGELVNSLMKSTTWKREDCLRDIRIRTENNLRFVVEESERRVG